jgi:hypothetical protein
MTRLKEFVIRKRRKESVKIKHHNEKLNSYQYNNIAEHVCVTDILNAS